MENILKTSVVLNVLEYTPNPYLILNTDFTIAAVNEAYLTATSTKRPEILGRNIFDVFPDNPNDPKATGASNLRASLERAIKTKKPDYMAIQKYDIPLPGKGPLEFEERFWKPLNIPVLDHQRNVTHIIHNVEDVTQVIKAKRHVAELEESESRFREIANALPQIVWTALPDGYHEYFNDRWYEFTGAPVGSTFGETWISLFHPDDREKLHETWHYSLATGEPYEIEFRLLHHSGEYRWTLGRALPVRDEDGKIIRWFGTSTDIHEHKQTQEALNEAISEREMFLSIASHELKTPLTSLCLQAEIQLRKFALSQASISLTDIQLTFEKIHIQTKNVLKLVEEMLDLSRIRARKLNLELKTFDFAELLKDMLSRMSNLYTDAGSPQPILEECPEAIGRWDIVRIEQVISNLLTNSIRYGSGKTVRIKLELLGSKIRLSIKDEGIGIAAEDLGSIFERYIRATGSFDSKGLGLGLYITKQIVLAHKGKIWVESEVGKGSTFYVELPKGE